MDFEYARKMEVECWNNDQLPKGWVQRLQVMRWTITHRPQDLPRNKHTLAEGKTLEEVTFIGRRSYRVTQNLRVVKKWYMFVWLAESMDLSKLSSSTREILLCLWGWPSVRMRDSLNHIQGNDLGAEWIDHHADLLLLFTFAMWNGKSRVTYL